MSNSDSMRGRILALCNGIQTFGKNPENRAALRTFADTIGPGKYPSDLQVDIEELFLAGANPHDFRYLLAYSPTVQAALAEVRDLLGPNDDNDASTWSGRMLDAERQLRAAVAGVQYNAIDDVPLKITLADAAFGFPEGNGATPTDVKQRASESRTFHLLAFDLLGKGDPVPFPPGTWGFQGDKYLTEADFAKLCTIVCSQLPWVTALGWRDASNVQRTEYMRAVIETRSAEASDMNTAPNGNSNKAKRNGKRGRQPDPAYDPNEDRRLCNNWNAAKRQGMTRGAFSREKGITVNDLIAAQDREKYRRRRDAE